MATPPYRKSDPEDDITSDILDKTIYIDHWFYKTQNGYIRNTAHDFEYYDELGDKKYRITTKSINWKLWKNLVKYLQIVSSENIYMMLSDHSCSECDGDDSCHTYAEHLAKVFDD